MASAFNDNISNLPRSCVLIHGLERESYTEISYQGKEKTIEVIWQMKNEANQDWPSGIKLVPLISSPSVRTFNESKICALKANSEAVMRVKIELPSNFKHQHLVVMLKLRNQAELYFGPNFILVIKLIEPKMLA